MIARLKLGIFKPKTYFASIFNNPHIAAYITYTPNSVQQALTTPTWKQAINEEYTALMHNNTWELVPCQLHMNTIDNKWI